MKKLIFTIWVLIFAVILNINSATGQWVPTGPYGVRYTASSSSGTRLYLSNLDWYSQKIFMSTDNGAIWSIISDRTYYGITISFLKATEIYLFKCESDGTIERTSNEGQNGEYIGNGIPPGNSVSVIETCNGLLFAGITSHGIFRSTDYGDNWVNLNNNLTNNSTIVSLVFNGNYIFAADKDYNIFRGDASEENWTYVCSITAINF